MLVISGTDGIQSHTMTLWRLLERYHVPTFIYVNKMDLRCGQSLQPAGACGAGLLGDAGGDFTPAVRVEERAEALACAVNR